MASLPVPLLALPRTAVDLVPGKSLTEFTARRPLLVIILVRSQLGCGAAQNTLDY